MMKRSVFALATLVLTCVCVLVPVCKSDTGEQQMESAKPAVEANPADVKSMDAVLAALYDVISGPAGKKRDWDRFRSLFAPGARLIPAAKRQDGGIEARVLDPEGYVTRSAPFLEKNGFYEREIARKVESFGHIAHVFSTYESRHEASDKTPFARGINSIQLLNDGKRWWIVTVYWDSERPDNPLPPQYLPANK
ncbi:MAG TPA: hypothetical protein VKA60_09555 [Blastocatellia bacterium]|nr:hypothetical protein [Blastocatellia bacterium]